MGNCKAVQNPKGKRNWLLQVETEPHKDETLATSSGRNTQDSFTRSEQVLMGLYITVMPALNTRVRRTNLSWLADMQCMTMSGVGKCYDNARMESFFATLKKEKLYRIDTTTDEGLPQ